MGLQRGPEVDSQLAPSTPSLPYDSNRAMQNIFPWPSVMSDKKGQTLDEIARVRDQSLVPVLIENLQYLPPGEFRDRVTTTLR